MAVCAICAKEVNKSFKCSECRLSICFFCQIEGKCVDCFVVDLAKSYVPVKVEAYHE